MVSQQALRFVEVVPKSDRLRRDMNVSGFHFSRVSIIFLLVLLSFPVSYATDPVPPMNGCDYKTAADFATGLFTDLVPLLSLFGTEFSKQFMS